MKSAGPRHSARPPPSGEITRLRARLEEVEEALLAIRNGEVDAVVVAGNRGPQVFTLQGADQAYRVLIESMNEGALTLTADTMILYANQRFAEMVKSPLEQVIGGSFRRFLSAEDRATLRPLLKRPGRLGSKTQVLLSAGDGSRLPVQVSIRQLENKDGFDRATLAMVVTDMTASRRSEEMLQALSQRLVEAQEAERGHVALELHDHITQLLCAALVRSQALADRLSASDEPSRRQAVQLREMLGKTAEEVERISRDLRPGVLEILGLVAVLRVTATEFAERTGVSVKLACAPLTARLTSGTELALYRILQEALKNVEKHAHARHAAVSLRRQGAFIRMVIQDDGIGFDRDQRPTARKSKRGLGLLSMRERAAYVGGTLKVLAGRRSGTVVEALIPLPPRARAAC